MVAVDEIYQVKGGPRYGSEKGARIRVLHVASRPNTVPDKEEGQDDFITYEDISKPNGPVNTCRGWYIKDNYDKEEPKWEAGKTYRRGYDDLLWYVEAVAPNGVAWVFVTGRVNPKGLDMGNWRVPEDRSNYTEVAV